jgi:hypothetical protein
MYDVVNHFNGRIVDGPFRTEAAAQGQAILMNENEIAAGGAPRYVIKVRS